MSIAEDNLFKIVSLKENDPRANMATEVTPRSEIDVLVNALVDGDMSELVIKSTGSSSSSFKMSSPYFFRLQNLCCEY